MTKYMCRVITKNYPVTTITPMIGRYTQIKKNFTASEIACCLTANASVTLLKKGNIEAALTKNNFKDVLIAYSNELAAQTVKQEAQAAAKKNTEVLEAVKESVVETTPEVAPQPEVFNLASHVPIQEEEQQVEAEPVETVEEQPVQAEESTYETVNGIDTYEVVDDPETTEDTVSEEMLDVGAYGVRRAFACESKVQE